MKPIEFINKIEILNGPELITFLFENRFLMKKLL